MLKVTGPYYVRISNSPTTGGSRLVCGGAPQTQARGENGSRADPYADTAERKARTSAAHPTYLEALAAWERLVEADPTGSAEAHTVAYENAAARKETCRIAFRDLVDELGYLPRSDAASSDDPSSTEH